MCSYIVVPTIMIPIPNWFMFIIFWIMFDKNQPSWLFIGSESTHFLGLNKNSPVRYFSPIIVILFISGVLQKHHHSLSAPCNVIEGSVNCWVIGKEKVSYSRFMQNDANIVQIGEGFLVVLFMHAISQPCSCFCHWSASQSKSLSALQFCLTGKVLVSCNNSNAGAQDPTDDSNITFRNSIFL